MAQTKAWARKIVAIKDSSQRISRRIITENTAGGDSHMARLDPDHETGLPDLTELSLDQLAALDDSVVANMIRILADSRQNCADYQETFSNFGAAS
jgi:hypothetical protein